MVYSGQIHREAKGFPSPVIMACSKQTTQNDQSWPSKKKTKFYCCPEAFGSPWHFCTTHPFFIHSSSKHALCADYGPDTVIGLGM